MGKKSSKSKTITEPWRPIQDDILGSVGTVRDVVGRNQGNLESLAGDVSSFLPGLGERAFGDNPLLGAGNQYAMDVLGGRYLNSNPHLEGMIDATSDDVMDRVNSLFGRSGASLGTRHAGTLGRELASAQNAMRFNVYNQERQNQQGAASMIPSLFGSQFAGVAPYLAATQTAGTLPYAGLGALAPIIGAAGGSGTATGTQPGGWGNDLLNAAASIGSAAIMASARELKTDIQAIGPWDGKNDGLTRYRFRYRNDPSGTMIEGVMADEVKKLRPWAYVPNFTKDGKPGVNYAKLGETA